VTSDESNAGEMPELDLPLFTSPGHVFSVVACWFLTFILRHRGLPATARIILFYTISRRVLNALASQAQVQRARGNPFFSDLHCRRIHLSS
jgi:hypothetical protein